MREKHQSAKEYANTAHSQQQHEQRQQTHTTFTNGSQVTYTGNVSCNLQSNIRSKKELQTDMHLVHNKLVRPRVCW